MMYMSGSGLQIFSLMIVFQLIKGALSGMMAVNRSESRSPVFLAHVDTADVQSRRLLQPSNI